MRNPVAIGASSGVIRENNSESFAILSSRLEVAATDDETFTSSSSFMLESTMELFG
jgi:hypothetical protein